MTFPLLLALMWLWQGVHLDGCLRFEGSSWSYMVCGQDEAADDDDLPEFKPATVREI